MRGFSENVIQQMVDPPNSEYMVSINRAASRVEIAGRWFPAVGLICPPVAGDESLSERDRALGACGAASGDKSVYVPAENGLLFRVEEARNEHYHGLSLDLYARTCELAYSGDMWLWLPWSVGVVGGRLVPDRSTLWSWAEPEWVVETIDRIACKPFTQPDGPPAQIVRLSHFVEEDVDE